MKRTIFLVGSDLTEASSQLLIDIVDAFRVSNLPITLAHHTGVAIYEETLLALRGVPSVAILNDIVEEDAILQSRKLAEGILKILPDVRSPVLVVPIPQILTKRVAAMLYVETDRMTAENIRIFPLSLIATEKEQQDIERTDSTLNKPEGSLGPRNYAAVPRVFIRRKELDGFLMQEIQHLKKDTVCHNDTLERAGLIRRKVTIDLPMQNIRDTLRQIGNLGEVLIELGALPHKFVLIFPENKLDEIKGILKAPTAPKHSTFKKRPETPPPEEYSATASSLS